jgi:hypothetical protein
MLYEAFDEFLAGDTWHTRHPADEERFYITLHGVVKDPQFNPDKLGDYMRQKAGVSEDGTDDRSKSLNPAIDDYVEAAWTVKDYLKANRHTVKST